MGGARVDVDIYLGRIGCASPVVPDLATLASLQLAHMTRVPFENLHVHAGIPVRTALAWSLPKIVDGGSGGWCFELNGAFSALLRAVGYDVTLHSARVFSAADGELGPPIDHLCPIVHLDGDRLIADVGFGDSSLSPVRIAPGPQHVQPRRCRVEEIGGDVHLFESMPSGDWELQYVVDPVPRELPEFQPRSDELASGAGGPHWTEKPFVTRALDASGARIWLLRDRVKVRRDGSGATTEEPVDAAAWDATLLSWFGMTPPGGRG